MIKKVLVTGAGGFIGSHLTEALVCQGYKVRAFVMYNSFNSWGWLDHCSDDVKGNFEVFAGDVRDPHGVKEAMKGCDAVLHLAALIAIPYSYHSPDTYVDTNIKGTLNSEQGLGEVVNFGSNFEISIGDTAQLIAEAMSVEIEIITDEVRLRPKNSEVDRLWADNEKAKQLFGWQPGYGGREGFKRGLSEMAEWFAQQDNLRGYKAGIYNI